MAYTDIDDPSAYFQTTIYTGNGSARALTFNGNSDLQPDWVWIKKRAGGSAAGHVVTDSVRGVNKQLFTNEVEAEESYTSVLTAFGSNGFSLSTAGLVNTNTNTYVAWNWKAGTSFTNDASATGIGTIDSTGSVSTAVGFSICSWTGNATDNATVKHGLSQKPDMVIIKARENTSSWLTWHKDLTGAGYAVFLDGTDAQANYNILKNQSSSVLTLSTNSAVNANNQGFISYNFHSVKGYSKFSSYTGNGNADGTFIYTGFSPAFVMVKRTNGANSWNIKDNRRNNASTSFNINPRNATLLPNDSAADQDANALDFLSNGFKNRSTGNDANNASGTYIYMAFAENPFTTSTGVPTTAR